MSVRQVAGPDAAFLYGERPEWHFHVSALTIVNPADSERFSFDEVVDQVARRIHRVPQFRWKLVEAPLRMRLDRPIWVDDPDFDVRRHMQQVTLPSPGDDRALGELVGRLVSYKIDRSRPLWEMWFIDGLAGGRAALLTKIHHSIIDGQSGAELATLLYDFEANPEPEPDPPPYQPQRPPGLPARLAASTANSVLWPLRATRLSRQLVRQGVAMSRHALGSSHASQAFQAPRTPLNGRLSSDRSFACAEIPLADVKAVKNATGVKLNDVVLAIGGAALRGHLLQAGALPEAPLVAQVPVSLRTDSSTDTGTDTDIGIGTKVAAMFCSLATDIADPLERLAEIHRASTDGKQLRREMTEAQRVNLTDTLPPALIAVASRLWSLAGLDDRTPPIFNLIVSNVAGPPFDLFLAGGRIDEMYPMGPLLAGSGVNFTVVSHADRLDFGLMGCPTLVPDLWDIADRIGPALDELVAACAG